MLVFGIIVAYFAMGLVITTFFDDPDAQLLVILWGPALLLVIPFLLLFGAYELVRYGVLKFKKYRKSKIPPTPTEVMQGIVATVLLQHFKEWRFERTHFSYKNIELQAKGKTVLIGGDQLDISEELQEAIKKSRSMAKDWQDNQAKYEKEQRMLSHLEEFMGLEKTKTYR